MNEFEANILSDYMGDRFSALSPLLQAVHTGTSTIEGEVNVQHGNVLAKLVCRVFGFPKENKKARLTVNCSHSREKMYWVRDFDGHIMESHFIRKPHSLIEKLGPLDLYFAPNEENGALNYQFHSTRFLGIPMPSVLSPTIVAREYEAEGKYHFYVSVHMFAIGLVLSYGGRMALVNSGGTRHNS